MLRSAKKLTGFKIQARDGEIGSVHEFLFDDEYWTIRYLVADIGGWRGRKLVLIPPPRLLPVSWEGRFIPVAMTRDEVLASPDINQNRPMHMRIEAAPDPAMITELRASDWAGEFPTYWAPGISSRMVAGRTATRSEESSPSGAVDEKRGGDAAGEKRPENDQATTEVGAAGPVTSQGEDPHLGSAREVIRYQIQARDGQLGHIADVLIDDSDWTIRSLIVDIHHFWTGKKVQVDPADIDHVDWMTRRVHVDLDRDTIRAGPAYNPEDLLEWAAGLRTFGPHGRTVSGASLASHGAKPAPREGGRSTDSQNAPKGDRRSPP